MTDKPVSRRVAIKPAVGARRKVDYSSELNPEQLAVVMHPGGPMLVLAGAGSGKTAAECEIVRPTPGGTT